MRNDIIERLAALRQEMKAAGIAAVIIPQADPHMSEYLSDHWKARKFLSGFTGSAGNLIVTTDRALLWTDSRYFLQASDQISGTGIELMKDGLPGTPSQAAWLCDNVERGKTVGVNGMLLSIAAKTDLELQLNAHGIALDTDFDPVDKVWTSRPRLPKGKVFVHPLKYAGKSAAEKIKEILADARRQLAGSVFISALDEIAWTLNLRCNDVRYNPVLTAYLYLSPAKNILFIDPDKIDENVAAYLKGEGVDTLPYESAAGYLKQLGEDATVLLDTARTSAGIFNAAGNRAVKGESCVAMAKACKNAVEIEGELAAMRRDGAAMVKSLREIERRIAAGEPTTEWDVCLILRHFRSQSDMFFDESFGTIAGYADHGAVIHYEPDERSAYTIKPKGLLLIDSGAQYYDGTTDITRTIALSTPTEREKRDFTLVAKGHIALAWAVFPAGTCGTQLDVLARQYMWKEGVTYLHGTGHGVGSFLNVHEGPHQIRMNNMPAPISLGMVTSNEPGIYRDGVHGVRLENLMLTVPAMETEFGKFLRFDTITLCPIDSRLLDTTIMTPQEIEWVNTYHARVLAELSPLLEDADLEWLRSKTAPITQE